MAVSTEGVPRASQTIDGGTSYAGASSRWPPTPSGRHRSAQAAERLAAGPGWQDGGATCSTTTIGTPLDPTNLRPAFDILDAAASIEGVSPYVLRHSGASLMLDSRSASLEEVADVLGDNPATLLRHYRHRVRPVAEATKRMQAVLEGSGEWPMTLTQLGPSVIWRPTSEVSG